MKNLTKEMFCSAIQSIKAEKERVSNAENALSLTLIDGWVILKEGETVQALINLLIELMGDNHKDSMIEWWLFERVDKYVYDNNGKILHDLTTAEALYDYLVEFGDSK